MGGSVGGSGVSSLKVAALGSSVASITFSKNVLIRSLLIECASSANDVFVIAGRIPGNAQAVWFRSLTGRRQGERGGGETGINMRSGVSINALKI